MLFIINGSHAHWFILSAVGFILSLTFSLGKLRLRTTESSSR